MTSRENADLVTALKARQLDLDCREICLVQTQDAAVERGSAATKSGAEIAARSCAEKLLIRSVVNAKD
jgi:hypothetical protein